MWIEAETEILCVSMGFVAVVPLVRCRFFNSRMDFTGSWSHETRSCTSMPVCVCTRGVSLSLGHFHCIGLHTHSHVHIHAYTLSASAGFTRVHCIRPTARETEAVFGVFFIAAAATRICLRGKYGRKRRMACERANEPHQIETSRRENDLKQ